MLANIKATGANIKKLLQDNKGGGEETVVFASQNLKEIRPGCYFVT